MVMDLARVGNSSGNGMEIDYPCLCALLEQNRDVLIKHQCEAPSLRFQINYLNFHNVSVKICSSIANNSKVMATKFPPFHLRNARPRLDFLEWNLPPPALMRLLSAEGGRVELVKIAEVITKGSCQLGSI
jgi:hypothetical protein